MRSKLTSRNFVVQFLFVAALFLAGIRQEYLEDLGFQLFSLHHCDPGIGRRKDWTAARVVQRQKVIADSWELRELIETRRHPKVASRLFNNGEHLRAKPALFLGRIGSFLK